MPQTPDPDDRDILAVRAVHPQLQREYRFVRDSNWAPARYRLVGVDAELHWRVMSGWIDAEKARDMIVFWSAKGWTLTAEPPTR